MIPKYFSGDAENMGVVRSLPCSTFEQLADELLGVPVTLPVTKAELMAMDKTAAMNAKRTGYIVPCVFKSSPSQRKTEHAVECNLVILDIDESSEASRLLATGFDVVLGDIACVVWHTARSTSEHPRLRVVVSAEAIPVSRYASAVRQLAGLMGMSSVSRESQVPVQPMFLPTCFSDETGSPVIHSNPTGQPFALSQEPTDLATTQRGAIGDDIAPLENLRPPMEGISPEDVASALKAIDADCPMQTWVEVGMGLKHQFGDEGYALWDEWSSTAKTKYIGADETRRRWKSFDANPADRVPVTLRSVIRIAEEAGWDSKVLGDSVYNRLSDWIISSARSTEELLDHGVSRIAEAASTVGSLKQAALIGTLARVIKQRGIQGVTVTSLTSAVKSALAEAAKAARPSEPPPWSSNIVFITASNLFYRYVDNRKMRPEVIDLIYPSPEPDIRPREWLVHKAGIKVVENLRYDPSTTDRFVIHQGVPFCNTYRATYPKPDHSQVQEVLDFFQPHADALFSPKWSTTMFDFAAYMVQNPGKKIRWVPLVQSGVGAGKGLWAGFLTQALGWSNVQRIAAEHVLEATYNSWAAGYQLTVMDEVYIVGHNSHRVMNKLKPSISDDFVSVRALYEPVQTVPNLMNFVMFTNHHNSLAVHDDDRRYFVLKSPLQSLPDIAALGGDPYFDRGYALLRSHSAGIRALLESWPISPDFRPEGRAPVTPFLRELAAATASPLSAAVQEAIDDQPHALVRPDLVSISVLRAVLPTDRLAHFTDQGLSAVLREKGFVSAGRHFLDGARHTLWVRGLAGDPLAEATVRLQVL